MLVVGMQLAVHAPARFVGRNGIVLLPAAAGIGIEILAGIDGTVHRCNIEARRVGQCLIGTIRLRGIIRLGESCHDQQSCGAGCPCIDCHQITLSACRSKSTRRPHASRLRKNALRPISELSKETTAAAVQCLLSWLRMASISRGCKLTSWRPLFFSAWPDPSDETCRKIRDRSCLGGFCGHLYPCNSTPLVDLKTGRAV